MGKIFKKTVGIVFLMMLCLATACGPASRVNAPEDADIMVDILPTEKLTVAEPPAAVLSPVLSTVTSPSPTATPEPTATPKPTDSDPLAAYTIIEMDKGGYINKNGVNMRKGPSTRFELIATLDMYTPLRITGECDGWYRVRIVSDNSVGFIKKDFVTRGYAPEPTPKPKPTVTPKPSYNPSGNYTEEEVLLVAKLAYLESGHTTKGFKAVASVVLNRVLHKSFPNTIEGVIYAPGQFSVVGELDSTTPSNGAINAVRDVLNGNGPILPKDVLNFRAARLGRVWGNLEYYCTIANNCYFRRK